MILNQGLALVLGLLLVCFDIGIAAAEQELSSQANDCGYQAYINPLKAYEVCTAAAAKARAAHDAESEASALSYRGMVSSWAAQFDAGLADAYRAVELTRDNGPSRGARAAALAAGTIHRERGDAGPSLQHLTRAVRLAEEAGDRLDESAARGYLARTLFWVGDYEGARAAGTTARDIARAERQPALEFNAVWQLGMTALEAGDAAESIRLHLIALRIVQGTNIPAEANIRMNLADGHARLGQFDEAAAHLAWVRQRLARGEVAAGWAGFVDELEGRVLLARGEPRAAIPLLSRGAGAGSAWLTIRARLGEARARRALGDATGAAGVYRDAIAEIERTRRGVDADSQKATYLGANTTAYHELVSLLWETRGESAAAEAFSIVESGRARALADALHVARVERSAAPAITLDRVRQSLQPGQLLVEYAFAEGALFVFGVANDSVTWLKLPDPVAGTTAQRVAFFRKAITENRTSAIEAAGRRLYDDLLAPIVGRYPGAVRLIISPDGVLHDLPFDALSRTDGGRTRFLASDFDVSILPSAELLVASRPETTPVRWLAVADPQLSTIDWAVAPAGFRAARPLPLPYARAEAELAAPDRSVRLVGEAAREADVKRLQLDQFDVLHFATHAMVDQVLPLRSALLMSGGQGDDGFLEASEIYAWKLKASLVVLSACGTAAGHVVGGEGVQSLARAFLYAGSRSVVATLWEIDDRQGVELMADFYRGDIASPGAALAAAKRKRIAAGAPATAWSAFIHIGPPGTPNTQRPVVLIVFGSTIIALLLVVGAGAVRKSTNRRARLVD